MSILSKKNVLSHACLLVSLLTATSLPIKANATNIKVSSDSALESGFSEDRHAQIIYFSMIYVCQVLLNSRKNIFYVM